MSIRRELPKGIPRTSQSHGLEAELPHLTGLTGEQAMPTHGRADTLKPWAITSADCTVIDDPCGTDHGMRLMQLRFA